MKWCCFRPPLCTLLRLNWTKQEQGTMRWNQWRSRPLIGFRTSDPVIRSPAHYLWTTTLVYNNTVGCYGDEYSIYIWVHDVAFASTCLCIVRCVRKTIMCEWQKYVGAHCQIFGVLLTWHKTVIRAPYEPGLTDIDVWVAIYKVKSTYNKTHLCTVKSTHSIYEPRLTGVQGLRSPLPPPPPLECPPPPPPTATIPPHYPQSPIIPHSPTTIPPSGPGAYIPSGPVL